MRTFWRARRGSRTIAPPRSAVAHHEHVRSRKVARADRFRYNIYWLYEQPVCSLILLLPLLPWACGVMLAWALCLAARRGEGQTCAVPPAIEGERAPAKPRVADEPARRAA
jgi:hypothetical protein